MVKLVVDKPALLEPNLLVPFKAPVNNIRLNPYWKYYKDLFYVYCSAVSSTLDLVSKTQGTLNNDSLPKGSKYGLAYVPTVAGTYINSNRTSYPSVEPYNTILCVGLVPPNSNIHHLFGTRYNSSNSTYYAGVLWTITSTNFDMYYGSSSGTSSSYYRNLTTNLVTGPVIFSNDSILSMCGCFKSSSSGSLYLNGVSKVLTANGLGGAVAGTARLTVYNTRDLQGSSFTPIYLLAIFNTQLPDQAMQNLSADPYQMFTPL
jgi:hypothetical protein